MRPAIALNGFNLFLTCIATIVWYVAFQNYLQLSSVVHMSFTVIIAAYLMCLLIGALIIGVVTNALSRKAFWFDPPKYCPDCGTKTIEFQGAGYHPYASFKLPKDQCKSAGKLLG